MVQGAKWNLLKLNDTGTGGWGLLPPLNKECLSSNCLAFSSTCLILNLFQVGLKPLPVIRQNKTKKQQKKNLSHSTKKCELV